MTTKYNINEIVYDTLTNKCYSIKGINIRDNGTYYLLKFTNEDIIMRAEKDIRKHLTLLDKSERRYLNDVIRPFRNKVRYIVKRYDFKVNKEFLEIKFDDEFSLELPYFDEKTMYKNMKHYIPYSLEDLDLL